MEEARAREVARGDERAVRGDGGAGDVVALLWPIVIAKVIVIVIVTVILNSKRNHRMRIGQGLAHLTQECTSKGI